MTGLWNVIRSMKGVTKSRSYSALLQSILLLLHVTSLSAELFHLNRDPSIGNVNPQPNHNKVITDDQCKQYLCKYGYLKDKCECHSSLLRTKRSLKDYGLLPTELETPLARYDDDGSSQLDNQHFNSTKTKSLPQCSQEHFTEAFKQFQNIYHLEQTAVCDQATKDQMSKRRCGQPDTAIDKLKSDSVVSKKVKRSLYDILSLPTSLDRSIERRKKQYKEYIEDMKNEVVTLVTRNQSEKTKQLERYKRSVLDINVSEQYDAPIGKKRVSWRIMSNHYSNYITPQGQRAILKRAVRHWSEVSPLCFYEDNQSPTVDIEIGFLKGAHLSCYRQFDGFGGELAHKYIRDVHFDNDEPYTEELTSATSISLLMVAAHELGHVLGLNHSDYETSVMNAIYHRSSRGEFELSDHDRQAVRDAYGPCSGKLDTAFDYVRTKPGRGPSRVYNTYFFRSDHYWMYENAQQRARYGDPLQIQPEWNGVPSEIDAFLHYFKVEITSSGPTAYDEYYFFKGDRCLKYDSTLDKVVENRAISVKFPPSSTNPAMRIPNNLDSVFFDHRDKKIYFFKGEYVYAYQYTPGSTHSCCASKEKIRDLFPPATRSDLTSSDGSVMYTSNLDSVYFSYYNASMFFIKGDDVWKNTRFTLTGSPKLNSMKYVGKWYNQWMFVCDADC